MNWADKIREAHTRVTDKVSHHERLNSERYFVWQEEGDNALHAENGIVNRAMRGTTDLFTKLDLDPWAAELEKSMTESGIAWYLNTIQYEEDTGFRHWEWVWEVLCDG